jgi:hypothetical protein
MLQIAPKQQNLELKRNRNGEEKRRDEEPEKKMNPEGGDLYSSFSVGNLLLSVALNSVGNIRR